MPTKKCQSTIHEKYINRVRQRVSFQLRVIITQTQTVLEVPYGSGYLQRSQLCRGY